MTAKDSANEGDAAPDFDDAFRKRFADLLAWRRDVRRFRPAPLPDDLVMHLLTLACRAPSVGLSEPWRFVLVESEASRDRVRASFRRCNDAALAGYEGEKAKLYASLKLSGLEVAPVHLAVFAEDTPEQGAGLGRRTMPETVRYSVVAAIQTLWLAARAHGVGLGWVSILEPDVVAQAARAAEDWRLVGYLCLGYPERVQPTPELEEAGWEERRAVSERIFRV
ncbi:5,6-dimethylbenzimidazole synthase [Marivibrio halodurans]|uniref:5,6-dimethylbenzimidazole synthase n=1 Tax=Marivibrio halodurans TaxID=2039722 RepID=A0A8J7V3I0_9PROT|nr:5,6-dimethylbenzimidazole synthase [Marivibrio halodurans]MBP5858266.1 5,6-dimethylbenzimidazole synthase [Marivibrio halodurans]